MAWSRYLLLPLIASIDYASASHAHHHGHAHIKRHVENLKPRDVDWADRIPADMMVEFRTLTTTVYEDCRPTNTIFVTTTVFEDIILQPTHIRPESVHSAINNPQSADSEPTTTIRMTKTVTDVVTDIPSTVTIPGSAPEDGTATVTNGVALSAPTRVVLSQTTVPGIHTTITTSIPGSNGTVSVAIDVGAPSRQVTIEGRPIPVPPTTDPAPGLLPKLPDLPQLLSATAVPDVIGQVFDPHWQPLPTDIEWTALPKDGKFATKRFGGRSAPKGTKIKYKGNIGIPWGSNIIAVSPTEAHRYKYVVQFQGSNTDPWTVTIWNKVGPDAKMDGWYGHSALAFVLAPSETKYVAFDEDSEGAWGAAPGTKGLPRDQWGGFTSTWGEFTFGDRENDGWSGWDVSAIQAQLAHHDVQGMRICQADGKGCSIITPGAKKIIKAYTASERHRDGIGGAAPPGPVRLVVDIDYRG